MFVVQLNSKSLKEKLTWDDIKQSNWYGLLTAHLQDDYHITTAQREILTNPEKWGVDLNNSLIFFASKNSGTDGELVLEGSIKSEGDFEQFNKTFDSSATVKKG